MARMGIRQRTTLLRHGFYPAGEGAFTVAHASPHLLTNIAVVGQFLPVTFSLEEEGGMTRVTVKGKDVSR